MQVQEAIQKRLSIRQYAEDAVPDEHMKILLKALQRTVPKESWS